MGYKIENRRYTGSKAKLVNWIMELIQEECSGNVFLDIFAGTGVVAKAASLNFKHIIVNDLLYSNNLAYKAFFEKGNWHEEKLRNMVDEYNSIDIARLEDNYFSTNFGGKYFHNNVAKAIGFIREEIEKEKRHLTEKEYNILLTSLMYSADRVANTVGHYDAYLRKKPNETEFVMELIEPCDIENIQIYREDANVLSRKIVSDVVYIDPPYNSRQYSRFYHVLETLIKWDKPELFGVARKPEPENMSEYCRNKAPIVFKDLIDNLKCKYIVVSYNNTYNSKSNSSRNKITLEQIQSILQEKGNTKVFKQPYRYFNSGKTEFSNHQELLFITKVGV